MLKKTEPNTKAILTGVMGWPVDHSLSPRLHGFWIKKYGLAGRYVPLAIEPLQIEKALRSLANLGFSGVNLTIPHKKNGARYVDFCDTQASIIGAVNTVIVYGDGKIEGRNTDVFGFTENLKQAGYQKQGDKVVVLGAGGASRAVLVGLKQMGFEEIHIVNRTTKKAEELADELHLDLIIHSFADSGTAMKDAELLINTTSLGMVGQEPLNIDVQHLPSFAWVNDIVYSPLETELLKNATSAGLKTVDGLGMLLYQAAPAFSAWYGVEPEVTQELRNFVLAGL